MERLLEKLTLSRQNAVLTRRVGYALDEQFRTARLPNESVDVPFVDRRDRVVHAGGAGQQQAHRVRSDFGDARQQMNAIGLGESKIRHDHRERTTILQGHDGICGVRRARDVETRPQNTLDAIEHGELVVDA
jgi:hypothetical protein